MYTTRTEDRISRGRRAFNAVTSIGIKNKSVCMSICTTIFWAIIMPIVSYRSELWVLGGNETELLQKFQRYVGRKCQRFPKRSPNHSAHYPLGWLSIDRFIKVKKLLFLRTILVMSDVQFVNACWCTKPQGIITFLTGITEMNPTAP